MKYAIVSIQGHQYQVSKDQEIKVDKLDAKPDAKLEFDQVLLVNDSGKVKIGTPLVKGTVVTAKVIDQIKGKKIRVATYKAKSRYRRVKGHRSHLTRVKITDIVEKKPKPEKTKKTPKLRAKTKK